VGPIVALYGDDILQKPPVPSMTAANVGTAVAAQARTAVAPLSELAPQEDLHDGNICKSNEEFHAGLCYKKCSLLTGGMDVIRTSPWTCCESKPCTTNQQIRIGLKVICVGYAVSGEGKCPHRPGSCLANEEMMLGVCYKKCSILTNQEFTHRIAPATCCKKTGTLSCLLFPWKSYSSKEFAVGGGRSGPGACGQEAEMFMGLCYKRCALLTDSQYPHRMGPLTCCGAHTWYPHMGGGAWHMGCLDLRKDLSMPSFAVVGTQPSVNYSSIHWPLAALTEKSDDADDEDRHGQSSQVPPLVESSPKFHQQVEVEGGHQPSRDPPSAPDNKGTSGATTPSGWNAD